MMIAQACWSGEGLLREVRRRVDLATTMDAILQQSQSLFACRPQISNNAQLHIKPFFGFFLKPAEKTARIKAEMKEKTRKRFLLSQKHIVYTDPLELEAGKAAMVYYNPSNTALNGKPEVWFRGSFNRWTHRKGPLSPQKMIPVESGSHMKTAVPHNHRIKFMKTDYMMKWAKARSSNFLKIPPDAYVMDFVFSEKEDGGIFDNKDGMDYHLPVYGGIAKESPMHIVGGLGDVVTSLSLAVQDLNYNADIVLPKFFWVGCVYGRNNDAQRFDFFCHAALEFLQQSGFHPLLGCSRIITCNMALLRLVLSSSFIILSLGLVSLEKPWHMQIKLQQFPIHIPRRVAGNPAIAPHLGKFYGILNGIDPDIWDPFNDNFIPVPYTSVNMIEGKQADKRALQQWLGIKVADIPVVGIMSRLTHQKGLHLIKHAIFRSLEQNGQVVLLGSAPDPRIQKDFVNLEHQLRTSHSDHARLVLTYDEPLSHLLVAMRYGSIPVVRKTGGLYDTVFDVDHDKERAQVQDLEPNGFSFEGADTAGVGYAINKAISAWYTVGSGSTPCASA
ncbi:Soluble starch synthase 3, chloroplastic/amyloplastic-like protein [Drosera capensis]